MERSPGHSRPDRGARRPAAGSIGAAHVDPGSDSISVAPARALGRELG
jgi:hypothetical protein